MLLRLKSCAMRNPCRLERRKSTSPRRRQKHNMPERALTALRLFHDRLGSMPIRGSPARLCSLFEQWRFLLARGFGCCTAEARVAWHRGTKLGGSSLVHIARHSETQQERVLSWIEDSALACLQSPSRILIMSTSSSDIVQIKLWMCTP